jgi:hypothetical protein
MYYVGIVNPRRDTSHVVTEKDEPYEVEFVVVDYGMYTIGIRGSELIVIYT